MDSALLTPSSIKGPLRDCGYRPNLLRTDFPFGDHLTVPLVGFAQPPVDSRSACIAVLSEAPSVRDPRFAVEACRALGTPVVFVCFPDTLQWWKQGGAAAEYLESAPADNVERFFQVHKDQFSPETVYRAKTWGRYRRADQLSFVDLGLMPVVEEQVGKSLETLVVRNVSDLKESLGWKEVTDEQGHWLLKAVFWLLSGKILRDKEVEKFERLDLQDVAEVFRRVARHYGAEPLPVGSKQRLNALRGSACEIDRFSSLALTTTESLAYVYENALISKETRSSLGTHTTPSFLVDYIVGNLTDWVEEIPVNERTVFEPACGQAAFLVSAMRLLTEMLPVEKKIPSWRGPYLRSRLHGTDIDPFALELARLSLTLTDIPNPDGWDLTVESMFAGNHLGEQARRNTILLANPPFENFKTNEHRNSDVRFFNKSAEMLWRTLPQLPAGGVFGVVVPQTILHSDNARVLRELLVRNFELKDICLFPDRVFSFSDAESAIIVGRRKRAAAPHTVRYRRIRERELPLFRSDPSSLPARDIPQSRLSCDNSFSFRLPDLEEVWNALADNPVLANIAAVAKGLDYLGCLPSGSVTYRDQEVPGSRAGFVRLDRHVQLHGLPKLYWMSLAPSVISSPRSGTAVDIPQVLLNYARASRGPWRLKALIDKLGHPVTSNFIPVRPTSPAYSLEILWALLNSPVANAYAFSHLGKRHNIVGDIRRIPMPKPGSFERVQAAADAYLAAASSPGTNPPNLQKLLLRVDCEVLGLYSLPFELEQSLLGLFTDWERVGVPFSQNRYLPKELESRLSLFDFLQFENDWSVTNRERGMLIDKSISGSLTTEEQKRLDALQIYADYHIEQVAPRPTNVLDELEGRLFSNPPRKDRNVR
jgi:hypothetical protein